MKAQVLLMAQPGPPAAGPCTQVFALVGDVLPGCSPSHCSSSELEPSSKGSHSRSCGHALGSPSPMGGGSSAWSALSSCNWKLPGPFFHLHPWKLIVRLSHTHTHIHTHTAALFPADGNPSAVKPVPIPQNSLQREGKKKRNHLFLLGPQRWCR